MPGRPSSAAMRCQRSACRECEPGRKEQNGAMQFWVAPSSPILSELCSQHRMMKKRPAIVEIDTANISMRYRIMAMSCGRHRYVPCRSPRWPSLFIMRCLVEQSSERIGDEGATPGTDGAILFLSYRSHSRHALRWQRHGCAGWSPRHILFGIGASSWLVAQPMAVG